MLKNLPLRFRNSAFTLLGLGLGYLTLCLGTRALYVTYISGDGHKITAQFLACSAVCGIIFAALSGYITALSQCIGLPVSTAVA